MKTIRRLLLGVLILMTTVATAGPIGLGVVPHRSIPDVAHMLLLGIGFVVLAGYSRKRLQKK